MAILFNSNEIICIKFVQICAEWDWITLSDLSVKFKTYWTFQILQQTNKNQWNFTFKNYESENVVQIAQLNMSLLKKCRSILQLFLECFLLIFMFSFTPIFIT